jgi:hypothetical protein
MMIFEKTSMELSVPGIISITYGYGFSIKNLKFPYLLYFQELFQLTTQLNNSRGGSTDCYRCFRVTLKTTNVVHLLTDSLDRCYPRHTQAIDACPTSDDAKANKLTELLLFRK